MVNRGPDNVSVLRFIKNLGDQARVVLGNHDLHLLAASEGARKLSAKDTLHDVLAAKDCGELLLWLRQQPLMQLNNRFIMSHAGIPHIWSTEQALTLAEEVSSCLKDDTLYRCFLHEMYGNAPSVWCNNLTGNDRLRVITNYFTRMRFISAAGELNLTAKESAGTAPEGFSPWFHHGTTRDQTILFGHWAALEGITKRHGIQALDTGCVWGHKLTAMNLKSLGRICEPAD